MRRSCLGEVVVLACLVILVFCPQSFGASPLELPVTNCSFGEYGSLDLHWASVRYWPPTGAVLTVVHIPKDPAGGLVSAGLDSATRHVLTGDGCETVVVDGNEIAWRRIAGSCDEMANSTFDVALFQPDGSVIVAGTTTTAKFRIIQYSLAGIELWDKSIQGDHGALRSPVVATNDSDGNLFAAINGSSGLVVAKIRQNGEIDWMVDAITPEQTIVQTPHEVPSVIKIDGEGNVYVAGTRSDNSDCVERYVVSLSADGNQRWLATEAGFFDTEAALVLTGDGLVIAGGNAGCAEVPLRWSLTAYDGAGVPQWTLDRDDGQWHYQLVTLTADFSGGLYGLGFRFVLSGDVQGEIVRISASGETIWSTLFEAPVGNPGEVRRAFPFALAADGNATYVAWSSAPDEIWVWLSTFVSSFSRAGDALWTEEFLPTVGESPAPVTLHVNEDDGVFLGATLCAYGDDDTSRDDDNTSPEPPADDDDDNNDQPCGCGC